jgi:hypothetical protein
MKKFWLVSLVLATALAAAPVAKADSYEISFSGAASGSYPGISGSGLVTLVSTGGGNYNIQSGLNSFSVNSSLTGNLVQDPTSAVVWANFDKTPITFGATDPGATVDADSFDNILTLGSSPYLDGNGILITLSNGGDLIIWSDGNTDYWNEFIHGSFVIGSEANNGEGGDPISLDITPAPEPSSLLLLGTGLLCMAGILFWKFKPTLVRAA